MDWLVDILWAPLLFAVGGVVGFCAAEIEAKWVEIVDAYNRPMRTG